MASEDVIELGSSDEDTAEPAPKKRKTQLNAMVHIPSKLTSGSTKRPLNAMVHIPNKLPSGLTVTPSKIAKSKTNLACVLKGSIGTAVTVTKVSKHNVNPFAKVKKINGNTTKSPIEGKSGAGLKRNLDIPIQKNPFTPGVRLLNKSSIVNAIVNKPSSSSILKQVGGNKVKKLNVPPGVQGMSRKLPIKISKPPLNNTKLPPEITIKRTILPSKPNLKSKINGKDNLYKVVHMSNSGAIVSRPGNKIVTLTEVPTVELDDDEPATSLGPQWYLRPEVAKKTQDTLADTLANPLVESPNHKKTNIEHENSAKKTKKRCVENSQELALEKQNNKEPDESNYIEITIEDSPAKAAPTTKGFQVGAELAITIEDSPVRKKTSKTDQHPKSDDEEHCMSKNYQSKKKLQYPSSVEALQVVEIEFEPLPPQDTASGEKNETELEIPSTEQIANSKKNSAFLKKPSSSNKDTELTNPEKSTDLSTTENKIKNPIADVESIDIVEIEESPIKPADVKTATPNKNTTTSKLALKPAYKMEQPIEIMDVDEKELHEFQPIYRDFIKLCFHLENSQDMKTIVEKKIKAYYRQVPKEYTDSETFTDMLTGKIMAMKAGPEKMYLYIKDVVDELNLQRKLAKAQPAKENNEEQEKFLYGKDSEFDAKRQRQIGKLEKTLKKLHRAIQKLEEEEVDFDDEEDSVYILTESEDDTSAKDGRPQNKELLLQRYKDRSVRVHAKLCQLTNTKMPSEARVLIDPRPGQPKGPAKRLEKWINRKVPIGTPLPFPDFHDVLRCVREANKEDKIGWNEADIMEEARDLFVRCGKKLQRRRQENEWRLAASRVPIDTPDPAEDSSDLKRKLAENRRLAAKKETELFNKYADRQNQLKLEAVEIGDKEAEESPVESDDEVEEEVKESGDSATNKEKRKERIKKLLQKSKVSDNKMEQPDKLPDEDNISKEDTAKESTELKVSSKSSENNVKGDTSDTEMNENKTSKSDLSNSKDTVELDSDSKGKEAESDVDENHLMERRFFVLNSSSDTGSAIAIDTSSDEKTSDDREIEKHSDVISIENSSYSESEEKKGDVSEHVEKEIVESEEYLEETDDIMKFESAIDDIKKQTNEKHNPYLGDILLASSDEGDDVETRKISPINETCINLRDDNISIGDTLIIENREIDGSGEEWKASNSDKNTITDGSSVEGMEIGPMEIISADLNRLESIAENECEKSALSEEYVEETDDIMKFESAIDDLKKQTNEKHNPYLGDILLNSADDGDDAETRKISPINETCINLRDVNISVGDTLIIENREIDGSGEEWKASNSDKNTITDGSSVEGMEIISADLNRLESIAENECEKSPMYNEERSPVEIRSVESIETIQDENTSPEDVNETNSVEAVEITNNTNVVVTKELVINTDQSIDNDILMETNVTSAKELDTLIPNAEDSSMKDVTHSSENIDKTIENKEKDTLIQSDECAFKNNISDLINTIEVVYESNENKNDNESKISESHTKYYSNIKECHATTTETTE